MNIKGRELKNKLLIGSKSISDYVSTTFGPYGRTVILEKDGKTIATKDGNTVVQAFGLEDEVENVACNIIKQATQKTNDFAGDGTTSTTILSSKLFEELNRLEEIGFDALKLKEDISKTMKLVPLFLGVEAKEVSSEEEIENVAKISANGDAAISLLVKEAIDKAGLYGSVLVDLSKNDSTYVEYKEGFRFDSGYITEKFVNDKDRMVVEYNEPCWVIVSEQSFGSNPKDIHCLEWAARDNRPLIIIADDFDLQGPSFGGALANFLKGRVKLCLVKAPRFGEEKKNILSDLCVATGASLVSKATKLDFGDIKIENMGICDKVLISKYSTILSGIAVDSEEIEARINGIREQLKETQVPEETRKLSERIARLSCGVVEVKVGGKTEAEVYEKKHRIEDALGAVKATMNEGYVCGGTLAYYYVLEQLRKNKEVSKEFLSVLEKSFDHLLDVLSKNSGVSSQFIKQKIKLNKNFGYNFSKQKFENLLENGVIEPKILVENVILNSLSASLTLFNSTAYIKK